MRSTSWPSSERPGQRSTGRWPPSLEPTQATRSECCPHAGRHQVLGRRTQERRVRGDAAAWRCGFDRRSGGPTVADAILLTVGNRSVWVAPDALRGRGGRPDRRPRLARLRCRRGGRGECEPVHLRHSPRRPSPVLVTPTATAGSSALVTKLRSPARSAAPRRPSRASRTWRCPPCKAGYFTIRRSGRRLPHGMLAGSAREASAMVSARIEGRSAGA